MAGGLSPVWMSCGGTPRPRASGPNLLFIMADDLGYADLSGFGRTDYRTPVLDGLAAEGVRLTQAYAAAPVCSPTRVALMTGRYPARLPVGLIEPLTTQRTGLPANPRTLARRLRDAGYDTALIGKWHLGMRRAFRPDRHGFDEFFGFLGAAIDYASHLGTEHLEHDFTDAAGGWHDGYATDALTEHAVEYVSRARSRPFFLSLQYNAPHWPWQAPGDPPYPDSLRWSRGGSPAVFARMVISMDEGVGRVLEALRSAGLERETLVIFTSDNGGERFSEMGPFSQGKMTLWEGGIRVAAFARWPGEIPEGSSSEQVTTTMDWTATLLSAGGIAPSSVDPQLDGVDLLPHLRGTASVVERELFWRVFQRRQQKAVRSGDWKYLVIEEGDHLFQLAEDPAEQRDRKSEDPVTLARLRSALAAWEAEMLEPVPLDPRFAGHSVRSPGPETVSEESLA